MRLLHRDTEATPMHQQLDDLMSELIASAAASCDAVRADVEPGELANYCRHALSGASMLTTDEATDRLVAVVLDGLGSSAPPSMPAETRRDPRR